MGHLTAAPREGDWVESEPAGNAVEHRRRLGASLHVTCNNKLRVAAAATAAQVVPSLVGDGGGDEARAAQSPRPRPRA